MNVPTLAFLNLPGNSELFIILAIGLLLFGKRLPEVGRSLGKGIVEFKRGLKGIGDEIEEESSKPAARPIGSDAAPQQLSESSGDERRVSQAETVEHSGPSVEPTSNG